VTALLVILALTTAASADVTATKLDGTLVAGRLQEWSDAGLVLTTVDGSINITDSDLLSVQFAPAATDSGEPILELVDGTTLPLADLATTSDTVTAQLRMPPPADPHDVVIPLSQLRAVRLQPLETSVLSQWQEIRALDAPGDLLVVLQRSGKSLDYMEGVVGKISDRDVEFTLDGKTVRVARNKAAAIVFYRSDPPLEDTPQCVLVGRDGLRVPASTVRSAGDALIVETAAGLQLSWPLAAITSADFSAGKVIFVSQLRPAKALWQPLVALPAAASRAAKYGQPRFDRSATGGPLTLRFPDSQRPDGPGRIESYAMGLAIRSRTELVFRLPRGYNRFMAVAGIEPSATASGNVMLTVFGDDRLLVEAAIAGSDQPLPLELDVAGVKRLRILVDFGQNLDTGDWLNLCNARIVK
jgi:hypothetical protein